MYNLAFLALLLASAVRAAIYVTEPVQATTCTGGQSCNVQWIDDGSAPLLSAIGSCQVALYTGQMVLVQPLQSVDVSTTSSFSFTPDPAVGPNGQYYLVFTSSSTDYQGFSGSFTLTGMTGTTPGGGSSVPAPTPATTSSGSSPSAGPSTPGTSPSGSPTATGVATPSVPPPSPTSPTHTTTTTTTGTTTKPSTTPSATPSNAAGRIGASTSLGGLVAAFVLSYVLAF